MTKTDVKAQKTKSAWAWVLGICVSFFTIGIIFVTLSAFWLAHKYAEDGPLEQTQTIEIIRGQGLYHIADMLAREGMVYNADVFKTNAIIRGAQGALKAGEYEISAGAAQADILQKLLQGKVVPRMVTIREGLTSYEIVRVLHETENLTGEIKDIPAEGALLPETYDYQRGEDRNAVLARMKTAHDDVLQEAWAERADNLPFNTPEEAVTLASIIEKETGKGEERARVAGVFVNRLRKGMPLQTDPTVIYALTKGRHENEGQGPLGRRLLRKDLNYDSPYNTYKYAGLPPGPIANPGSASIEAALNPEDHDYFYFVADGTGGHVFSKTLAEHNRNAAKWRKIRRAQ